MTVKASLRVVDVSNSSWLVEHNSRMFWLRDSEVDVEPGQSEDHVLFTMSDETAAERGIV